MIYTFVKYTRYTETGTVEAQDEDEAREYIRLGQCSIESTDPEDGDGDIEIDDEDEPQDSGDDEHAFLQRIAPYQQKAQAEKLEITFHVFSDSTDEWRDDPHQALELYRGYLRERLQSARLYVQLYKDRENDDMEGEDCVLGHGPYPN